jgi:hypothetical protein
MSVDASTMPSAEGAANANSMSSASLTTGVGNSLSEPTSDGEDDGKTRRAPVR